MHESHSSSASILRESSSVREDEYKATGNFPLEYYVDFLRFLKRNEDRIEVITYDDLNWGDDWDFNARYPLEWKQWKNDLQVGKLDPNKIYVLLQHDVDSRPERTMRVIEEELKLGLPSNIMIFRQRHDRKLLKTSGELVLTAYDLDEDLLKHAENQGFVIGYHSNALEQALYDQITAQGNLRRDLEALSKTFSVRYFSAHGGVPGPAGENNNTLQPPEDVAMRFRWVHNGASPRFDGEFSDGGPNNPKRDPNKRDLRDFVRTWKPGRRYRVLTHPQYYHTPCHLNPRLALAKWYTDTLAFYTTGDGNPPWRDELLDDAFPVCPDTKAPNRTSLLGATKALFTKLRGR